MVDSIPDFSFKPTFPIASVAELFADRPVKEAAMRAQQQKQLVDGLQQFGQGVDSLVQRRMKMAQALAGAKYLAAQNPEMFSPQTTNVQAPVTQNQTAAFDPATGSVTPNVGSAPVTATPQPVTKPAAMDIPTAATALFGTPFADVLKTQFEKQRLGQDQQRINIEGRQADATEKNNEIQRMIQTLLAKNTIDKTKTDEKNTLLTRRAELTKDLATGFWSGFNNPKADQAQKQIAQIDAELGTNTGGGSNNTLPSVGQTVHHPSGVKITRIK